MLGDIVEALACPHCGSTFEIDHGVVRCREGHAFDVAREGYVNLLPGGASASTADTPDMVSARRTFLEAGHFAPIVRAIADAAVASVPADASGVILDAGAGTGYVLGALLDAMPSRSGVALDVSKHAIRRTARSHERLGAIVADVWATLPLRNGSAILVLSVFAPRNAEEFARVLVPGGTLIVVTPRDDHLAELVAPLGLLTVDPRKGERLSAKLSPRFERTAEQPVTYAIELSRPDAVAAAQMGPIAAHVSAEELRRRAESLPEPVSVTVSVDIGTYRTRLVT